MRVCPSDGDIVLCRIFTPAGKPLPEALKALMLLV